MRFIINTPDELLAALADRQSKLAREQLITTKAKDSARLGGMQQGLDEAIFYIGEYIKTLQEREAHEKI